MKYLFSMLLCFTFLSSSVVAESPFEIGLQAYKSGNYLKAKAVFRELAEQGDLRAQVKLGELYDKGRGGPKDYKEAVRWYRLAAVKSHSEAQYLMGVKYINGHGVPKDETLAYAWFAVALDNGYAKAAQPIKILNQTLSMELRQKALQMATGNLAALTHMAEPTSTPAPKKSSRRSRYR